jgi:hypothetical protein
VPIIVTFAIATLYQGKRSVRFDKQNDSTQSSALEGIENLMTDHGRRNHVLEERSRGFGLP